MQHAVFRKILAVLFGLVLTATGLWASAEEEEEPAAAMEKEMVMDPTTGKMVTAPEYGGTLTYPYQRIGDNQDPFFAGQEPGWLIDGVNEKLAYGNWALDREEYDFRNTYIPLFAFTGNLAESWETPDPLTYIFHIRQGVHYALNPDSDASRLVNGRELTANDVEHSFHRYLGLGSGFTEPSEQATGIANFPWDSIEATDEWTVAFKTTEPSLGVLRSMFQLAMLWILPPEVIEQYGDYSDWRNVVGTGPFILTDYVEGVSKTYAKNPNYWGFDEKFPANHLPYIDGLSAVLMAEEATRISALRAGKIDGILHAGIVDINSIDVVRSLQTTNPEIEIWPYFQRSFTSVALNIDNAPFDDVRVRHALQMALDLKTINDTYYSGFARVDPIGIIGSAGNYTPFAEWPAEIKQYYTYDPEGAEKLLDEAGYPRGTDGVRFKVDYQHLDIMDLGYVEIAASYWADIGVDLTINVLDGATWSANLREHNYEMSTGNLAFAWTPEFAIASYRSDNDILRELVAGQIETPELNAAYDAFNAASTVEGQMKAYREFEIALVKRHQQIWGPMAPNYQASQPWVTGFSGEYAMGNLLHHTIYARLWIDQDLKRAMGF